MFEPCTMANAPSPLVGYNNNVRHKGKLYHIQTEDSGVTRPHIITHLFADGGRIIASKKTEYSQFLEAENLAEVVKKLMQEQHKAMAIALRDCVYDEIEPLPSSIPAAAPAAPLLLPQATELDLDLLDRAAEAKLAQSATAKVQKAEAQPPVARDAKPMVPKPAAQPPSKVLPPQVPIRVGERPGAKSLDEVILSYLADDRIDGKR